MALLLVKKCFVFFNIKKNQNCKNIGTTLRVKIYLWLQSPEERFGKKLQDAFDAFNIFKNKYKNVLASRELINFIAEVILCQ